MSHTLPAPTALIGIAILSCAMSAAVFGSLLRADIPGLPRWFTAHALLAVGLALLTLLVLRDPRSQSLAMLAAFVLLVSAALLFLQGCRQFFGRPPSRLPEYAAFGAVLLGLFYWTRVSPDIDARGALLSAWFAYLRFAVGWTAYRFRPPHRPRYSYLFVSIAAFSGGFVQVARGLAYGFGWSHQASFLEPTPLNIAVLGLAIVSLPCLSIGMVMLAHDRLAERMERLATIDALTGALVRRAFISRAEALLAAAGTARLTLSLAILDLDNFKAINDRHGHAAGDQTLAQFVAVVTRGIRHADVLGRLGGEEFGVLFVSAGAADAASVLNQLRAAVTGAPAPAGSGAVTCSFSAGVDEVRAGDTLASVMARADAALYTAKAMGRNCVVIAPSVDPACAESLRTD